MKLPGLGFEPRQREPKSLVLPLHYPGETLHIILSTPLFVNSVAGTQPLGLGIVGSTARQMVVVPRRGFPRLAGIEFDSLVLAFAGHFDNHKTDEKYSQ